jgi:hypothetical protein
MTEKEHTDLLAWYEFMHKEDLRIARKHPKGFVSAMAMLSKFNHDQALADGLKQEDVQFLLEMR